MINNQQDFESVIGEDANWAAFLYLTDELSVEETDLFENQLAEREDLQLALIETTRQIAALAVSDQSFSMSPSQQVGTIWRSKAVAVIASFAACVAVAVFSSSAPVRFEAAEEGLGSLAQSIAADSEVEVLQAWVRIQSEDTTEEVEVTDTASDLSVPDWMFTAVLLEAEDFDQTNGSSTKAL